MKRILSLITVVIVLLVPAANAADITIEQVRQIVREELAAREAELDRREKAVAAREQKIQQQGASESSSGESEEEREQRENRHDITNSGPFALSIGGYGEMQAKFYDDPESLTQAQGNRGQSKTTFDTERFTVELEGEHHPSGIEFEAEIEFEHGGTGSSQEIEFDEFGEFETETEKGGEVELEEVYLKKDFGDGWSGKVGRFYLGTGMLSRYYRPTDYLGSNRDEVEEFILPGQWREIGLSVRKDFEDVALTFQLVNGLDSTGFSASHWVSTGYQSRFEGVRAEDLAGVARVDLKTLYPDLTVGAAVYAGNSTGNRPKDDLEDDVDGTVIIGSADYRYWAHDFKSQGAFYIGHLNDADEISERNARLPNTLGVERTAIADGAIGVWTELGYNIAPFVGLRDSEELSPFVRFDYYDTYYDVRDSLADNGRYERFVYAAGVAYMFRDFVTLKADWSHREFGLSDLGTQDSLGVGVGFVY